MPKKERRVSSLNCLFLAMASLVLLFSSCRYDKKTASIVFPTEPGASAKLFRSEALVTRPIGSGGSGGDGNHSGMSLKWSAPSLPVLDLDGDGQVNEMDALRAVAHLLDGFLEAQFGDLASRAEIFSINIEELPAPFRGGSRGVSLENLQAMRESYKHNMAGSSLELIPSTGEEGNRVILEARLRTRLFFARTGIAQGLLEFNLIRGEDSGAGNGDQVLLNGLYARLQDFSALLGDQLVEISDMVLSASEPILLRASSQISSKTSREAIWRLSGQARGIFLSWRADGTLHGEYVDLDEEDFSIQVNFLAGATERSNPAFQLQMQLPSAFMGLPGRKGKLEIQAQGRWINRAPMAWAANEATFETEPGQDSARVELNGAGTAEYDDEEPSFMWIEDYNLEGRERLISNQKIAKDVELGMGRHIITLLVKDQMGAASFHTTGLRVQSSPPRLRLSLRPDLLYVLREEQGGLEEILPTCSLRDTGLPITGAWVRVCGQLPPKKRWGGFDILLNNEPVYGLCGETALDLREPRFQLQLRKRLTGSRRAPGPFRYTVELLAEDSQGTLGKASSLVLMSPPVEE